VIARNLRALTYFAPIVTIAVKSQEHCQDHQGNCFVLTAMKNLLRIFAVICCALFGATYNASAATAIVNVAMDGIAAANQPVYSGQSPNWLIDGSKDAGNVVHGQAALDPGFAFTIDLQKDYSVSDIKVYPRQNACCPDRLSNFRVSLHADDGAGGMGAEVWGIDQFTDGSNPGSGAGIVVDIPLPETKVGRWIEIRSLANPVPQYALQMSEVEVFASVDAAKQVNRAINAIVTANQPLYSGQTPSMLVDGNRESVIHGQSGLTAGFAYTVDLGLEVTMDHINVIPRQDGCCPDRLTNYRLSVFKDNNGAPGDQVYSIDLHTDQSNPGSTFGSRDVIDATIDPAFAGVKGQWVKIESLDDPIADYALQIAELEVYGTLPDIVKLQILTQPQDAATGTGLTATFSVLANALGGDNSLITYQWQKNDVDIPGATSASYTTPLALAADAGTKYRVIVSYPGQPTQTSSEAILNINWARGAIVTANGPLWPPGGFNPQQLTDGDRANFLHGDADLPTGFAYDFKLGGEVTMTGIDIYPRNDCCPDRLSNIRVSVHSDNNGAIGDTVWSADLFTDGSNAGPNVVHVLPSMDAAGTMKGKWVRVEVLSDPVPSYALQMAELEVYGTLAASAPVLSIVQQPTDFAGAPGRTARVSVNANVFNGDPALISIAWKKNGVLIPGASGMTYITDILQDADNGAKYRAVISYPGVPDVESNDATLTFDYNYARGSAATTNQKLWVGIPSWTPAIMVDGDVNTFVHGDTGLAPGFAYFFNMGSEVTISNINIFPRQDGCCAGRLSNFRVSIHKDNNGQIGDQVWVADFYTDQSNAGSGPGAMVPAITADLDPTGTFKGQWIKIESLDDPIADYSLQIAEVEAIGSITQAPIITWTAGAAGALTLNWSGGTLESATSIAGPWAAVTPAPTSPFSPPRTETAQFFRLKQ
jgi:hypothetical protein